NVELGSIIYSDCWRGYVNLNNLGYEHYTVNHSGTLSIQLIIVALKRLRVYGVCLKGNLDQGILIKTMIYHYILQNFRLKENI
ncbi:hypothetical protein H311_05268, partial [Anncaliia algerae PRA109]